MRRCASRASSPEHLFSPELLESAKTVSSCVICPLNIRSPLPMALLINITNEISLRLTVAHDWIPLKETFRGRVCDTVLLMVKRIKHITTQNGTGVFSRCLFELCRLPCRPPVTSVLFPSTGDREGTVLLLNSVTLSQLSVYWTAQRGDCLYINVYQCVCVCVFIQRGNQCKKTHRLPQVICAALVKWTSMMQQPHTPTLTRAHQTSRFHLLSPCSEMRRSCIMDGLVL